MDAGDHMYSEYCRIYETESRRYYQTRMNLSALQLNQIRDFIRTMRSDIVSRMGETSQYVQETEQAYDTFMNDINKRIIYRTANPTPILDEPIDENATLQPPIIPSNNQMALVAYDPNIASQRVPQFMSLLNIYQRLFSNVSRNMAECLRSGNDTFRPTSHTIGVAHEPQYCLLCLFGFRQFMTHRPWECGRFVTLTVGQRQELVFHWALCEVCLKWGHFGQQCGPRPCTRCPPGRYHNSVLCPNGPYADPRANQRRYEDHRARFGPEHRLRGPQLN